MYNFTIAITPDFVRTRKQFKPDISSTDTPH